MFLIRPAYLYFERICREGLLVAETISVFYAHELLGLQNDASQCGPSTLVRLAKTRGQGSYLFQNICKSLELK